MGMLSYHEYFLRNTKNSLMNIDPESKIQRVAMNGLYFNEGANYGL